MDRSSRVPLSILVGCSLFLVSHANWLYADEPVIPQEVTVGGFNSPPPSPPPRLILDTAEVVTPTYRVKVPVGEYTAPEGGAAKYSVPGPIIAFMGPDKVWRGHGYLETYPRLLKFSGKADQHGATLRYSFENDKAYTVRISVADGVILLDETANLGPRNVYVFDCYYDHWLPSSGFALSRDGQQHTFVYLPCYYDKPEITIKPSATGPQPGGVAVLSEDPAKSDIAGFWCVAMEQWTKADTMGLQLWQRRQLPGDPSSRHFLGPETKSDSTPNPRTAPLLGQSLYEGHVMIELNLGTGTRRLAFIVAAKGASRETLINDFRKITEAHR